MVTISQRLTTEFLDALRGGLPLPMPTRFVAVGNGLRRRHHLAEIRAGVVGEAGRTQRLERERCVVKQEFHRASYSRNGTVSYRQDTLTSKRYATVPSRVMVPLCPPTSCDAGHRQVPSCSPR